MDIPKLTFPRDEIIEIIPAAYQNEAKRVHIPGLDVNMVPGSPDDIRIMSPTIPTSGEVTPIAGLSTPAEGASAAAEEQSAPDKVINTKVVNTSAELLKDKVADED